MAISGGKQHSRYCFRETEEGKGKKKLKINQK